MNNNITLEDLLDKVDYNELGKQLPTKFALEFITFIKLVNGGKGEENKTPVFHYDMLNQIATHTDNLFVAFRGSAKALALDTEIITPDGFKLIKNIEVGDEVIDRNGKSTIVTRISEIFNNQCYEITLVNGEKFIANEDHLHIIQRRTQDKNRNNYWKEEVYTTKELLDLGIVYNRTISKRHPKGYEHKWAIPLITNPVEFKADKYPIDPYTVGLMLGDGTITSTSLKLTGSKDDLLEYKQYIPYNTGDFCLDKRTKNTGYIPIKEILVEYRYLVGEYKHKNKQVPVELLYGTVEDRLALLQGLMDSDGTITKGNSVSFTNTSKYLADSVVFLVKSLGGQAKLVEKVNKYNTLYQVHLHLFRFNPFRLKRKANKYQINKNYKVGQRTFIDSIVPIDNIQSKCISVASETKSYLINNCTVTHNTSLLSEYMILYLALNNKLPLLPDISVGMYISDTMENGVKNMRKNLESRYSNSEFLKKYIPKARFTESEWEFENLNGKKLYIRGFAAQTGFRGFKQYGQRPVICILDDLMSDKNAQSPTITEDITNIIYKAARQAMHPTKRMIIWTGTPFNKKDPLYKASCSGAWNTKVYPVCEKFPCLPHEFKGAWADRFPYEFVFKEYDKLFKSGEINAFNQELMLRIMSDEDRLVLDDEIITINTDKILENRNDLNFYMTTDFAVSEKEKADYNVVCVWTYTKEDGWILIDGVLERCSINDMINHIFTFATKYKVISTVLEASGVQKGFVQVIEKEMINRQTYFPLFRQAKSRYAGVVSSVSKLARFNAIIPLFKQKKIKFDERLLNTKFLTEGINQIKTVTVSGIKASHDDFLDPISQLAYLNPFVLEQEEKLEETNKPFDNSVFSSYNYEEYEESDMSGFKPYL